MVTRKITEELFFPDDVLREGFNKKTKENMDLSIFGWVGQDGDNIHKKQKKTCL